MLIPSLTVVKPEVGKGIQELIVVFIILIVWFICKKVYRSVWVAANIDTYRLNINLWYALPLLITFFSYPCASLMVMLLPKHAQCSPM